MTLDGFDPRDLEELAAAFERAGEIDPLHSTVTNTDRITPNLAGLYIYRDLRPARLATAFKEQAARASADPRLAWRQALSEACQAEGVSYHWIVEHRVSAFGYPGCPPANIGDDHLAWLASHEARPAALAAAIKAALLDPRFRAWPLPGEGDDE